MSTAVTRQQDIAGMMREIRELAATRRHRLAPHMTGNRSLTPDQARRVLEHLRGCAPLGPAPPCEADPAPPASSVPPPLSAFKAMPVGYYATPRPGTETIDYWLIEEGKGRWEGTKFARRVLGGQSADARRLRSERIDNMQQRVAMQKISDHGLEESANLFAGTLARCIDCSSPLTDEESRRRRKGPVCAAKH